MNAGIVYLALAAMLITVPDLYTADEADKSTEAPDKPDNRTTNSVRRQSQVGDHGYDEFGSVVGDSTQSGEADYLDDLIEDVLKSLRGRAGLVISQEIRIYLRSFSISTGTGGGGQVPAVLRSSGCFEEPEKLLKIINEISRYRPQRRTEQRLTTPESSEEEEEEEEEKKFDSLSDDALKCLAPIMDEDTRTALCRQSDGMSSDALRKLFTSGINCINELKSTKKQENPEEDSSEEKEEKDPEKEEEEEDEEEDMVGAKQQTIMDALRQKPRNQWTAEDVDTAVSLAPQRVDDEDVDDIDTEVFKQTAKKLARLLTSARRAPNLDAAIANKIMRIKPISQMTSQDLVLYGAAMAAFDIDDLNDLKPEVIVDVDFNDMFFDDHDPRGLLFGKQYGQGLRGSLTPVDVGRQIRFRKGDPGFTSSVTSDLLMKSLTIVAKQNFDDWEDDDLWEKVKQNPKFQTVEKLVGSDLDQLGDLLEGMDHDEEFLDKLTSSAVTTSRRVRKSDFSRDTAKKLLEKFGVRKPDDVSDEMKMHDLGKLARGFDFEDFHEMRKEVLERSLPQLDSIDLDDGQQRAILESLKSDGRVKLPTAVLSMAHVADSLSLDDLDDFEVKDIQEVLNVSSRLRWQVAQASVLVSKLRPRLGKLDADDVAKLRHLSVGLSTDDISSLPETLKEALEAAETLGQYDGDLEASQSEAMAEKLKQALKLAASPPVLNERQALQVAAFLPYMEDEDLTKVSMSPLARKAFVERMATFSTRKISQQKMNLLAHQLLSMIPNADGGDDTDASRWDAVKVRSLGDFVAGLDKDDIKKLPLASLTANIRQFERAPLRRELATEVVKRIVDEDDQWKCRRERLGQMGSLLQYMADDKLQSICKSEMAAATAAIVQRMEVKDAQKRKRKSGGLARETEDDSVDDQKRVVSVLQESLASPFGGVRRRRNAVALTCTAIKALGSKAALLEMTSLATLSDADFRSCLETLGSVAWAVDRLAHLTPRAERVFGSHSSWTISTIRQAGSLVAGLSDQQIGNLALISVDALERIARHGSLSPAQLTTGFSKWLTSSKGGNAQIVTGAELASMSEFVCGATPSHILSLSTDTIKGALIRLGKSRSCGREQLKAYADKLVQTFGQPANWSFAVVNAAGSVLGGLASSHLQKLRPSQIAFIAPGAIPALPTNTLAALSPKQLSAFSTNQALAVTSSQMEALSSPQRQAITVKIRSNSGKPPSGGSSGPHAAAAVMVLVSVLVSLL